MIVKEFDDTQPEPHHKFRKAGHQAEKQMAFYLRRELSKPKKVFVFNSLRLELDGEVAQIDHLVLHQYGFIIIESKSVHDTIRVNQHGEFTQTHEGKELGMPSPIRQAELQRNLLQDFLKANYPLPIKSTTFRAERFKILVAISDKGKIEDGNRPKELLKAEDIVERIRQIVFAYRPILSFLYNFSKEYKRNHRDRVPKFKDYELTELKKLLLEHDTPRQPDLANYSGPGDEQPGQCEVAESAESFEPARNSAIAGETGGRPAGNSGEIADSARASADLRDTKRTCGSCNSSNINIVWNDEYKKYLFECDVCRTNTSITVFCETCGGPARVSKSNLEFSKKCRQCETVQPYFRNSRWIDPDSR